MYLENISDLRKYVVVGNEFSNQTIKPSVDEAKSKFFLKYFTSTLIAQLESYKNDADPVKKNAFELSECALAKLSMYEYLIPGQLTIQDGSISRLEAESSKTAYKNQISDSREQLYEIGFIKLNELISLMEANISVFGEWSNSPLKKNLKTLLIQSADEFSNFYYLHHNHTTFMTMFNQQKLAIDLFLRAKFSKSLVDEIILNSSLSDIKKQFRTYCCSAVAYYTIKKALEMKLVFISSKGLTVIEKDKDTSTNLEKYPSSEVISASIRSAEEDANRYLDLAYTYMYENPTEFGISGEKPTFIKTRPWV